MIEEHLSLLRKELRREHLAAFIFLSSDPHDGEYVPTHWLGREWISGFNGSAGTAVVTLTSAALWTDSRYFIAAAQQLAGTEFILMREKIEGTPTIAAWLGQELADSKEKDVGIDGTTASYNFITRLKGELTQHGGLTLRTNFDPLLRIWRERPPLPTGPITLRPLCYAGERAEEKIRRTRAALRQLHADGTIVTTLDDIAWLLNLRGDDVPCNPVFVAYLLLTSRRVTLFIDPRKLTTEVSRYLRSIGVETKDYRDVWQAVAAYPDYSILLDGDSVNYALATAVRCPHIVRCCSPLPAMKAVKNSAEIEGLRRAMLHDGVALVRLLRWLPTAVAHEGGATEMSVDAQLNAFRAEQDGYIGLSFATIAAYGEHGAIVHYEATAATDCPLQPSGLFLLDCGAHYRDGTTDITRTIALGPLSDAERRAYTLVLKGHIQLELAKFPAGTTGTQLDALARAPLWREGMNFLHGTGHGVGAFLNVHEGPHQIRMEWKGTPLRAGMTVTDEPGVYFEGRFGVRIENTLLIEEYGTTEFGAFLQFAPLTLCPIDTTPIIPSLLSSEEIAWLDGYHEQVYAALSPLLPTVADREWLRQATLPLAVSK